MHAKPLFGAILTLLLGVSSFAAPQEKTQDIITRELSNGNTVRTEMSLNVYRQEPYQAEYTEQVPYQVEETYYVDVPYQTTETYYENVPYTERVAYTDTEVYWDNDYVCRNVTKYRQECHNERVCAPGGRVCQPITECGTNAHGERICKTRNECRDEGPRDCRDVPQCRQVPYTDRECGYEQVRKTRTVTKYRDEVRYRQELRTRTVTKYRQEARTRTVTKYREETRCCVTKYRDVFDHQFTQPVAVVFPAEAVLLAGEVEKIQVTLRGSESKPDVNISVRSDIFGYAIDQVRMDGREKVFVLKLVPKWTEQNAGTASVQGLKLSFNKGQGKIIFKETVASARLVSVYTLEIRDQQSQAVILQQRIEGTEAKVFEIAAPELAREGKYGILLHVERHGVNVSGGALTFDQTASYEKKELDQDEIQNLKNKDQVQLVAIEGQGAESVLVFRDQTPAAEEIKSTYKAVIWKKLSNGKIEWLGEKAFAREDITRTGDELVIAFKAVGVNPAVGTKIYIDLVVNRTSAQYLGSQKVQFIVSKTF
ncbi:hypothetical protein [Bdellovibrio sp. HCB-162]|uniref:hypothetical protein n=1 Tax=Bdellovibrio sp. HCB-162 TaxID=3394234 RepID=UPI0039BC9B02